ncbi:MAG: glycosyl transferase [Opitutaceae bacterium]|nr:glycosyl transferase [Opitutaceae bacterium]
MSTLIRKLKLGRLFYLLYHRPIEWLNALVAAGGPFEQRRTERGKMQMELAASQLPVLPTGTGPAIELHLLTGRKFWYQTAFCLWSFARQAGRPLHPVIYDDGTLESVHRDALSRLFPSTQFIAQREAIARLDQWLPADRFPVLRERWQNYPNIRKLIDPHIGSQGWKLVIDSDLLFFRRPDLILSWCDQPERPLHAVDCETSYGYTRNLMNELAGTPVADLVNVGLTGLESSSLDWEKLEHWCSVLITRERTNYYLEQALIAMLTAGRACTIAPAADYVTLPIEPEASDCRAVMHHYVAGSKRHYFQQNWRRLLTDRTAGA